MSSTDYARVSPVNPPEQPSHLLDFEGLRQAVQLLDRIRQRSAGMGDDEPCPTTVPNYD